MKSLRWMFLVCVCTWSLSAAQNIEQDLQDLVHAIKGKDHDTVKKAVNNIFIYCHRQSDNKDTNSEKEDRPAKAPRIEADFEENEENDDDFATGPKSDNNVYPATSLNPADPRLQLKRFLSYNLRFLENQYLLTTLRSLPSADLERTIDPFRLCLHVIYKSTMQTYCDAYQRFEDQSAEINLLKEKMLAAESLHQANLNKLMKAAEIEEESAKIKILLNNISKQIADFSSAPRMQDANPDHTLDSINAADFLPEQGDKWYAESSSPLFFDKSNDD